MPKNPLKQVQKRKTAEEVVSIIAQKHSKSNRYVRMVISGERNNPAILEDYITYKQKHKSILNNLLVKAVEKAVPFYN